MFKVNDYVVYGLIGVCQITDIEKGEYINNDETEYYVLRPVYYKGMIIKTPVNNPKVFMREIISMEDVSSLITTMPEKETVWINDSRQRSEYFKAALRTGKSEEWAKLIKTIHLKQKENSDVGKKLLKTDEDIMKTAERLLNEELAIVLNISTDEVVPYILEHIL